METLLQKDLKLYRFNNLQPSDDNKYDYQLYRKGKLVTNKLSGEEYDRAKVVISGTGASITLIKKPSDIEDRELQGDDTFILTVINN
jgi:hypothetical protein